jgi:hypothetical protein
MGRHDDDYDDDDYPYDDDEEEIRRRRRRRRRQPDIGEDAGVRMLLPVGRSGWAIAAGYLGLFSLLVVPAPLALVTGIMAIRDMHRNPKKHGMGRAIFGLIMGGLGSIVLVLFLISAVLHGFHG